MRKYLILIVLVVLGVAITVHSQSPALDDLGTALVNHGMDSGTAGPTAAIIETAVANNNALLGRLTSDETNITGLLAQSSNQANTIATLQSGLSTAQGSISNDEQSIANLQTQMITIQGAESTDASNITALQSKVAGLSSFPAQVAYKAFRGQTASIPVTTIATPAATATYNLTLVTNCTGTGSVAVHVTSTSSLGQPLGENLSPVCANAGVSQNQTFSLSSGSPVTLSTVVSGTPTYDVAISVVQLGAN